MSMKKAILQSVALAIVLITIFIVVHGLMFGFINLQNADLDVMVMSSLILAVYVLVTLCFGRWREAILSLFITLPYIIFLVIFLYN